LFIQSCPVCASSKRIGTKKKNPFKFFILQQVDTQSHVELIDMSSHEAKGVKWLLHDWPAFLDFLGRIALPSKSSAVVKEAIIQLLSASIGSMALQSDDSS
jgi:hypothetical protein